MLEFSDYQLCLITDEKQRMYFLGFQSSAGYIYMTKNTRAFAVDMRYYVAARKILDPRGYYVACAASTDFSPLQEAVRDFQVRTVGIDFTTITLDQFENLKNYLPNVDFVDISEELAETMALKYDEELNAIAKACKIAEKSFKQVLPSLKEGVTEAAIAAELEYLFRKNGASDKSFDSIIAFGSNSAIPHHRSGKTRLRKNVPVLMDFGCIYDGYCSDMTRTLWFGDKPSKKFLEAYDAVYDAHMAVFNQIVPGMYGYEVDEIARKVLDKRGYEGYFTHSLGHGIGVRIHEYPWLAPKRENMVLDRMVFSDEPGVYFIGQFGIRIEDTIYLKGGVAHTFMEDDKKLIIINNGKIKKFKK